MAPEPEEDSHSRAWRAAAIWFGVALLLRLIRLGDFSLWGDEVYSLDNSLRLFTPAMRGSDLAFPLFFLLERTLLEIAGLASDPAPDPARLQFWLRVVPAVAGAAAVAAAFVSSRGFLSRRGRHWLAALICFSPWLLYWSQFARFYTLLLALVIPGTFELLRAQRDGSWRRGVAGTAWILAGALVHPSALLLLFGLAGGGVVAALLRIRPLGRGVLVPVLAPFALALPVWLFKRNYVETIAYNLVKQDAGAESAAQLLLGIGWNVGPVVALLALLGLPTLWRREKALAVAVAVGTGAPALLMIVLALLHKSVEQRYLIPLLPLALLPAAAFLVELGERLATAGVAWRSAAPLLALAAYAPGFVSEYIDGNRHDLAGAAALIRAGWKEGDGVIAETHALLRRYLPANVPDERLLEAPPPDEDRAQLDAMVKECARLWIVLPAEFEGGTTAQHSFDEWAWRNGRLLQESWRPRLDYHQNRLRLYLLEPARAPKWFPEWKPQ